MNTDLESSSKTATPLQSFISQLEYPEAGQRSFVDSHGRLLQAFHPLAGMADSICILGADGQAMLELDYDGVTYHKTEKDAQGRILKDTFIDPDSGDLIEVDFRLDQVTTFRDEDDGSVTAIVTRGGVLIYTESVARDGSRKRVSYEHNGRECVARTSKVISEDETARTSFLFGTTDNGRRLLFVTHKISKEKTEWKFDASRQPFELAIVTPGASTLLKRAPQTDLLEGTTVDDAGNVLWDVTMDSRGRLVLRDDTSGTDPAVITPRWTGAAFQSAPLVLENSHCDLHAGAVERFDDQGERVLQFFHGRRDVYDLDGNISWSGPNGERSRFAADGEVIVGNPEGGVEILYIDTALSTGMFEVHENDRVVSLKLSDSARAFLQNHGNNLDPRDFLRMNCRLRSKPHQIEGVLKQLDELSNAACAALSTEELQLVCANLLHHVAYPSEIYQGRCPATVAAAIQADFVLENPTRYVAIVKEFLRTGQLRLVGGSTVPMNLQNMAQPDSSGRDIASRIFQTAILRMAVYPQQVFENTYTGVGVDALKGVGFLASGLNIDDVSNVIYNLGGGETCIVEIRKASEIFAAIKATSGKSLLVAVNLAEPPFSLGGLLPPLKAQLLNVCSVDSLGATLRCYDPSGILRSGFLSLDPAVLFRNMISLEMGEEEGLGVAVAHGGIHGRRFVVSAGSLVKRR